MSATNILYSDSKFKVTCKNIGNIRWPITLARHETMRNTNNACKDRKRYKPMKV